MKKPSESLADYDARQERLAAANVLSSNDPVRQARLSRIPGYVDAMKNADEFVSEKGVRP